MDKYEIRKNIIIIALDNLVNTYTDALEFLNEEEKELASLIIEEVKEMLSDQEILPSFITIGFKQRKIFPNRKDDLNQKNQFDK